MVADARADMCNCYNAGTMVTQKIGRHTVEMYDTIDELPIVRFHKYQKLLLVDAGVGSDITAFDRRIERARQFLSDGKPDKAAAELENLRQCVWMMQTELCPRDRAFAALVTRIDGRECTDLSDDGLRRVTEALSDTPRGVIAALLGAVKKKIDGELKLYFPALFADSEVKEYYDLLRRRTLAVLQGIAAGAKNPGGTAEVEKMTAALITYSNPKTFTGSGSAEIEFDRQFENLCLVLSERVNVRPKEYTVLEFYNAFDFVQERAKEVEKAQKRANARR